MHPRRSAVSLSLSRESWQTHRYHGALDEGAPSFVSCVFSILYQTIATSDSHSRVLLGLFRATPSGIVGLPDPAAIHMDRWAKVNPGAYTIVLGFLLWVGAFTRLRLWEDPDCLARVCIHVDFTVSYFPLLTAISRPPFAPASGSSGVAGFVVHIAVYSRPFSFTIWNYESQTDNSSDPRKTGTVFLVRLCSILPCFVAAVSNHRPSQSPIFPFPSPPHICWLLASV